MRKRIGLWIVPLAVLAFFALGMGDMGLGGDDKTPRRPARNFTGVVTDKSLTTLAVSYINCEGKTNIKGYLGEMRLDLSFDLIQHVEFTAGDNGYANGKVTLRDGQQKQLRFKGLTRCYGESELGKMMITVANIKRIEFNAPPPPEHQTPENQAPATK